MIFDTKVPDSTADRPGRRHELSDEDLQKPGEPVKKGSGTRGTPRRRSAAPQAVDVQVGESAEEGAVTAYYNEIDLRRAMVGNLIDAGHIAHGHVDERSIVEVTANDLAGYRQCHFFAGIGGWSRFASGRMD